MPYTDNPATVPADQVRLYVGDTSSSPALTDNEVQFLIDSEGSTLRAAARAAEMLAARVTSEADEKRVGPLLLRSYIDKASKYRALAVSLWARAGATSGVGGAYAGGISRSDKAGNESNTDRVQPAFGRRTMDYPIGSPQTAQRDDLLGSSS